MKSLKIVFILWVVVGIGVSLYQTSFLHNAGVENIPPEIYGEIFGKVLAWCIMALPLIYLFLKFKKGN